MRHIISILVENEAGALSRIAGLFSARGYNIESLTVAPTEDASMSRMTIVTSGSDDVVEQITKQLNKLIEVVKVVDLSEASHIERELMLIKVRAGEKEREDMKRMADIFRGRIIDVSDNTYTIELTGTGNKLDAFIHALEPGTIVETVRTGASGIGRGSNGPKVVSPLTSHCTWPGSSSLPAGKVVPRITRSTWPASVSSLPTPFITVATAPSAKA
jgi:acetolactate synthase-1/3 small subunit